MNDKTEGIVLQSVRYGESSLIVKVFTRDFGLKSYMLKGAFARNSKYKPALFQNLNKISYVEAGRQKTASLGYLKDVQLALVYRSLPFVMDKSAILMFVGELLGKTITEQEKNEDLYDFVARSMQWLDLVESDYANFPLYFTLETTRHLGFYPMSNYEAGFCFDMMEGRFVHDIPLHPYSLDPEAALLLSRLMGKGIDEACRQPLNVVQRRVLLDGLIAFMRLHAPVLRGFRSHEVLRTVLG